MVYINAVECFISCLWALSNALAYCTVMFSIAVKSFIVEVKGEASKIFLQSEPTAHQHLKI
jgi:hypothetical protein